MEQPKANGVPPWAGTAVGFPGYTDSAPRAKKKARKSLPHLSPDATASTEDEFAVAPSLDSLTELNERSKDDPTAMKECIRTLKAKIEKSDKSKVQREAYVKLLTQNNADLRAAKKALEAEKSSMEEKLVAVKLDRKERAKLHKKEMAEQRAATTKVRRENKELRAALKSQEDLTFVLQRRAEEGKEYVAALTGRVAFLETKLRSPASSSVSVVASISSPTSSHGSDDSSVTKPLANHHIVASGPFDFGSISASSIPVTGTAGAGQLSASSKELFGIDPPASINVVVGKQGDYTAHRLSELTCPIPDLEETAHPSRLSIDGGDGMALGGSID